MKNREMSKAKKAYGKWKAEQRKAKK